MIDLDPVIVRIHDFSCRHNKYIVDPRLNIVTCGICDKELNPMWVLTELCDDHGRAANRLKHLESLSDKAIKKNKCKCEKCGQFTRIQK